MQALTAAEGVVNNLTQPSGTVPGPSLVNSQPPSDPLCVQREVETGLLKIVGAVLFTKGAGLGAGSASQARRWPWGGGSSSVLVGKAGPALQ